MSADSDVRRIAGEIVAREGGYVNDPDDPGGATKYGITIHTMRRLGLDLDRDGDVDAQDVARLSPAQAVDIFVQHYFVAPRIAELPEPLQASVFDMYVNAGHNAVKILQRLLVQMGETLVVDGAIGPRTVAAAARAQARAPHHLASAQHYFSDARLSTEAALSGAGVAIGEVKCDATGIPDSPIAIDQRGHLARG